jgi:hypothetical protein
VLTDVKSTLRVGDTLAPLIFMFDRTYLSNFSGDKKGWSVYMTIGNLSSKLCQMPSTNSIVMVALLQIRIKNSNIPQKHLDKQRQTNREVLNEVLRPVPHPLTFEQNASADSRYYNVFRADGNFRCCKPVLVAWLADCLQYSDLHHLLAKCLFLVRLSEERTWRSFPSWQATPPEGSQSISNAQ